MQGCVWAKLRCSFQALECPFHDVKYIFHVVECPFHDVERRNVSLFHAIINRSGYIRIYPYKILLNLLC